jgi:low affinity Fe/Cu permease
MSSSSWFYRLAAHASHAAGSAWMFLASLIAFVAWLAVGQGLHWSEDVHLWPTSLLTWLTWGLVVLIQHTQTRQEEALQLKLDELIRAVDTADNRLIGLEKQPPEACPPFPGPDDVSRR